MSKPTQESVLRALSNGAMDASKLQSKFGLEVTGIVRQLAARELVTVFWGLVAISQKGLDSLRRKVA